MDDVKRGECDADVLEAMPLTRRGFLSTISPLNRRA